MRHQLPGLSRDHERELRQGATDAERILWHCLRNKKFLGLRFRRQHRIGIAILDFYCTELRLAIELDGARHLTEEGRRNDEVRTAMLEDLGIRVVRFVNGQVVVNTTLVLRDLELIALLRSDEIAEEGLTP